LKKKTKCEPKDISVFQLEQVADKSKVFNAQISQLYLKLISWIVKMNSDSLKDNMQSQEMDFLKTRAKLMLKGIMLAIEIKRTIKTLILMHQATGAVISQDKLKSIV